MTFFELCNSAISALNTIIAKFLFFDLMPGEAQLPLIVAWLAVGAIICTLGLKFINIRGFLHAIQVVRGKYDSGKSAGDVSHFQALSAALSATVGLGNIAGVAIAISIGGPGATFWMILAGFLGMSSKFAECTLAQMYREVRPDGRIMGGAMEYLSRGLKEIGWPKLGSALAVIFAVFCIGGSLGGGNAFQVNQSYNSIAAAIPWFAEHSWLYGLLMSVAVGVVILGGIQRIAHVASAIVPIMCGGYILLCLAVLFKFSEQIPAAFSAIVSGAFTPEAGYGGLIGVLVVGFQRAAFSNEAGVGSAAIAHSAAKTSHPAREGIVALLEPFIDTILVCTMTALVIVITQAYSNPDYETLRASSQGAVLTVKTFGAVFSWAPLFVTLAILMFAYSTIISWYYYGERCFTYLAGEKYQIIFKLFYIFIVFLSASVTAGAILDFSDLMLLGMSFPNLIGVYLLFGKIKEQAEGYMKKLKNGEFKPT
jgi:AGCS family alanine or glycine:cation symporter